MREEGLERLIRCAQAGDDEARAEIVRRYAPKLRAVLRGRLGGDLKARVDTDDVLQSTLGVTLRDLPGFQYRGDDAFEGWLVQAATRRLLDAARRNRAGPRDVGRERPLEAAAGRPADLTTPTFGVEREEIAADVRAAVDRLDADERRIVELRSYEGLSFTEIAKILDLLGKDAARDRYRRALRRMGTLLGRHRERSPEDC